MDKEDRKNLAKGMSMITQMGLIAVVSVAMGVFIGYWLDRLTGMSPLFIIAFSVFGIAGAIKALVTFAKKL
jgi:F0F1-type ATP synthase assembly protein I